MVIKCVKYAVMVLQILNKKATDSVTPFYDQDHDRHVCNQ